MRLSSDQTLVNRRILKLHSKYRVAHSKALFHHAGILLRERDIGWHRGLAQVVKQMIAIQVVVNQSRLTMSLELSRISQDPEELDLLRL